MEQRTEVLTSEEFLLSSMGGEIEAGFDEFIELWQSSEILRSLIQEAVWKRRCASKDLDAAPVENQRLCFNRKESENRGKAIRALIRKDLVSPSGIAERLTRSHGGLSRKDLLVLLGKYKAGNRNLGAYMLVRAWKKGGDSIDSADIRLKRITLDSFGRAVRENRADFFNELADAITFLKQEGYEEKGEWNHDPGQWWQFHLLLYILGHPKERYPMREFVRYFQEEVGVNEMPASKTIRKFCRSHGIALDSTPGAPRKSNCVSRKSK